MKSKILWIVITILYLLNPLELNASTEYDSYKLSSTKQAGLKYEVLVKEIKGNNLHLKGWAYIDDVQHYLSTNDIKTTVKTKANDGTTKYYPTKISNAYNMTDIEYFSHGDKQWCGQTEYNKPSDKCNYRYNYVSFEVSIPLTDFKPGRTYDFYIYTKAVDNGKKLYTKMYTDNVNLSKTINGVKYQIKANLNLSNLKVNDDYVLVRSGPGKDSSIFVDPKYKRTYFYQKGYSYDYVSSAKKSNVTWFKVKIKTTSEKFGSRYLARPGSSYSTWISSPYVDYSGSGAFQVTVTSSTDGLVKKIYGETINPDNINFHVEVEYKNLPSDTNAKINLEYNKQKYQKSFLAHNGTQSFDFTIDKKYYKNQAPVTITLDTPNTYDNNLANNKMTVTPNYASKKTYTYNLSSVNKQPSGYMYDGKTKYDYYQTISIEYDNVIDNIDQSITNLDTSFDNYYAGGAFNNKVSLKYENNYPYQKYIDSPTGYILIDKNVLDLKDNLIQVQMIKNNNDFTFPKTYINDKGEISTTMMTDAIYPSGKNVMYTKLDLQPGEYNYQIKLQNVGINQSSFILNNKIKIKGHIIGNSSDDLFYLRSINSQNPMPEGISKIWTKNKLDQIVSNNDDFKTITIRKEALQKIDETITSDFKNNLNNEQLLKNLINNLKQQNLIKEE